jgi:hypothetical protein
MELHPTGIPEFAFLTPELHGYAAICLTKALNSVFGEYFARGSEEIPQERDQ